MGVPGPVVGGSFAFLFIALGFAFCGAYMRKRGVINKDESQIFCVSIVVATVCLWTMWLCTWLHQWHP
jgi:hypothetical protein